MSSRNILFATLAIGASVALAGPAFAEKITMKTNLDGPTEVPSNTTTGKGTADVTFDTASKLLTWKVTYSDLTGPATAGHFHGPAEPGKNAGVMVPLTNIATSPVEGTATLTDAQAADLMAGKVYVNVHTAAHPGGEIRGQLTK